MSWIRFIYFIANFYRGGLECFCTVYFLPTNIHKCWIIFSSKVYLIVNTLFRTSNLLWQIGSEAKSRFLFVRAWLGNEAWENPVEKLSLLHVNGIKEDAQKLWCFAFVTRTMDDPGAFCVETRSCQSSACRLNTCIRILEELLFTNASVPLSGKRFWMF
jgi:hypothetical protein